MDKLKLLYEQIIKGKISHDEAVKQFMLLENLKALKTSSTLEENKTVSEIGQDILQEKAINYFKKLLSSVIKLPVHRIEANVPLDKYGIDSVMIMQLTNQLEKTFGSLSKTLFFEYQNIQELTGYFLEFYREQLAGLLQFVEVAPNTENAKDSANVAESLMSGFNSRRRQRFAPLHAKQQEKATGALEIAVIGVSGHYPGARNIQEFWEILRDGKDCITEIPTDRWDHSLYFDEDKNKPGKTYSKWGGFLEGVDQFDPLFFNISPREAKIMDPQERLFLECVYETLEDAGYTREALGLHQGVGLGGNVGIYVGVMYEEYQLYGAQEQIQGRSVALSGNPSSIANRVSYFCNFHGPSMAVDTMCSSSLTAIHLACQSLQRDECELAIAGGVNISIHPNKYLLLGQGKFVSSKGRSESFGQGGDGYVPGEGVGAVLLKPLAKAIADGDHIYGIVKATAINHGGKTNGYTVPNPNAQAEVIGRAYKGATIDPRTVSYIEAHGTGTSLGDPIEITGLSKIFQEYTKAKQFCAIGSAKSNIGHCESAAGIAGMTKVLLQLKYRQIVPSLHSKTLNPNIDFSVTPFVVQQELAEWKRPVIEINGDSKEYPRIAGISSFGAGGSNAHVIVEEYIPKNLQQSQVTITPQNPAIIVLSAKNEERLKEHAQQLVIAIEKQQLSDADLASIAYTLQVGREAMEERLGLIVGSIKELAEKLQGFVEGQDGIADLYQGQVRSDKEALVILTADEEMQETVEKWISRKKYAILLGLWIKGLIFDWNKLYRDTKPCRISLPVYPFAKERYWLAESKTKADDKSTTEESIPENFVQPIALVGEIAHTPKKINGISLQDLSTNEISSESTNKTESLITLVSTDLSSSSGTPISISGSSNSLVSAGGESSAEVSMSGFSRTNSPPQSGKNNELKPIESLQQELRASLAEALYMKQSDVNLDKKFIDMGLDSIVGIEWIKAVNKQYGTSIPATKIYDYPSIGEFAKYLAKELHKQGNFTPDYPTLSVPSKSSLVISLNSPKTFSSQQSTSLPDKCKEEKQSQQVELSIPGEYYGLLLSNVHSLNELSLQKWIVPEPESGEVTIQVKASAINFPDVMCVQGLYPTLPGYPFVPGFEVSGIVSRVGSQAANIHIGDEVIALTGKQMGGHASYVNVPLTNIVRKPPNISFEEACSLPVVFATAYYAFAIGKLAPKEHVLIQTATGGCGFIAIQLARLKGCVCYGTSSKQGKLDVLREIGIPYVINYKTTEFDQEIKRITNNRGIDVVLNTLSGDAIQQGLNCLGPSGRYLEIAVHALKTSPKLDLSKLVQNQSIHSIDLRRLSFQEGFAGQEILNTMVSMIQNEQIVPIVSRIYPISQIKEALQYVSQGQHIGKVVVSHTQQAMTDLTDQCIQRLLTQKRNCETNIPSIKPTVPVVTGKHAEQSQEGIAIIGMSGQFPKAKDLAAFWDNLAQGKDCISEIPGTRWSIGEYYDEDPKAPGKTYCKWMGVLEDVDQFDPLFFNISPAEAELMDPQQRLFLENCWHCIEDAGLSPALLSGSRCGVFVGCATGDYQQNMSGQGLDAQSLMGRATSILSARISYLLNLKGPCLAIDTACSSSLVAIAEACNSLILQTSDLALAGGVCVMAGPSMQIMTSAAGMLSKDGRCYTFDTRANGFVPGEGVGVVLLKRLADAVRDQDHIYGVIRGWGINQDGKTNGITAPSVNSQTLLEQEVYRRFNINPETISLVEAHGTGTKLGDPIEVEALTESFRSFTNKKNYCALGSVKSNIGHLLTAAGVSGVLKVLLTLQHRMLPPMTNYETLNEHISLDDSPFYINTKLQPWKVAVGMPRCACVSSFGFSGTNAHIVIEEYQTDMGKTPIIINSSNPILFVLSAKSKGQLRMYAESMKSFIESYEDINLTDMAYTLQAGREAMDYRLAFLADSRKSLLSALAGYIDNNSAAEVLTDHIKRGKDGVVMFEADEDAQVLLQTWIQKRKLKKLAEIWVRGYAMNWELLYEEIKPHRISVPTYPFARQRYWTPEVKAKSLSSSVTTDSKMTAPIHPLLQQNTADFDHQKFSSTFTGKEIFLADHIVKGRRVLPGVAHIEMVRAAVEQAAGISQESRIRIRLKNVVWARPIVGGEQPVEVHVVLFPEDNGEIAYEIYSEPEDANAKPVVYSQGIALLSSVTEVPTLDIKTLQVQCNRSVFTANQCYQVFRSMGIDYGPAYQGIEMVQVGSDQVLAKLSLPSVIADTQDQFVLHPSLLDSALQSSIGLVIGTGDPGAQVISKLALPFALQELEVLSKCTPAMWVWIRYSDGRTAGDKIQKLDIDICDDKGNVCVRLKGYSARVPEDELGSTAARSKMGTLMLEPVWKEKGIIGKTATLDYDQHLIMLCEPVGVTQEGIATQMKEVRCFTLQSQEEDREERFQAYTIQIFEEIQSLVRDQTTGKVLIQTVVSTQDDQQAFTGLAALLKTAKLENPKIIGQLIEVEPSEGFEKTIEKLRENSQSPLDDRVRYQDGKRYVAAWDEVKALQEAVGIPWRDRGIYLITGGAGGLGLIFAEEIAHKVADVTLILTGRSTLNEEKKNKLKGLAVFGARVEYRQVDVSKKQAVVDLIQKICEEFGEINGIIHSAGVIRDNYILKKTKDELQEVLAPKVKGVVNLDQASKDLPLDFFILFSSGAGVFGNPGQADYAVANAFLDAYARHRNKMVVSKQRQGRTLAINWPLWQEGGMRVDAETEKMLMQTMGMIAMHTSTGIKALYQAWVSGKEQVLVMEGDLPKLQELLLDIPAKVYSLPIVESISQVDPGILKEKTIQQLKAQFGEITKLDAGKIDADEPLESYGIDSIMITRLNQKLADSFGELSKTLFYEYHTLRAVAGYFVAEYPQECMRWIGFADHVRSVEEAPFDVLRFDGEFPVLTSLQVTKKLKRSVAIMGQSNRIQEPIAIIGISGRFPQAKNLEEYWENLKAGKECITEIPENRWLSAGFYHSDPQGAVSQGKSYSKWGAFLDEFDQFDPLFFNMSPHEAENIDPQERLFLEECWKSLEDAGYNPSNLSPELRQRTGVFGGVTKLGFNLYGSETTKHFPLTSFSSLVNRVSYFLNLQGPSIPIDAMCSSALVAIHEACEYIRQGKGDLALAGGVNLYLHPATYIGLSRVGIISGNSKSAAFGEGGKGFVPGEGVGVVVLKAYDQAIKDRDSIYAVIRGTAVNHNGKTNSYTTPNPNQQAAVIQQALEQNNIDPRTVSYIEAAASGSEMGDAIEMTALTKVFSKRNDVQGDYKIGSVKPNIGHCESASGMSQLTKVILSLNHKTLVPTLLTGNLNPNINFAQLPFKLQQEVAEWKPVTVDGDEVPRRAGITGIGAGGVNAHIIVEEYIPAAITSHSVPRTGPVLFLLSAKSKDRLEEYVKHWTMYLREHQNIDLESIAYTLQTGREEMTCRLAIVINSQAELIHQLEQWIGGLENAECCYFGDLRKSKIIQDGVAQVIETGNLKELAKLWVIGNSIPWCDLYYGKQLFRITKLPTYPFNRRKCWLDRNKTHYSQDKHTITTLRQNYENKAVEFYTLGAEERKKEFQEEYLTFCPFEEKIPGFSMSRALLNPEKYPDEIALVKAKQIEMRQVLFCKEDFNHINTIFDIGCGHGTDVIQIAALYPHIQTHGFTITQAQADLGNQRIAQMKLSPQAKIFHKDSSKEVFPGRYDIIIGIEVSFHIRNKHRLFQNIASALHEDGKVLLMDYIANLRGPIVDNNVGISIPTQREWIDILSQHNLVIDEIIDVSPQIANYLYDPEVAQNIKGLPQVVQDTFKNYANQTISLERSWISYCLFKLKKDTQRTHSERLDDNANKIAHKIPYPKALEAMLNRGHIPYPKGTEKQSERTIIRTAIG